MNYIINMNDWCKAVCDNYSNDCLNRECADKYNKWLLNGAVQNELWEEVENENK